MKKILVTMMLIVAFITCVAQVAELIELPKPNTDRGMALMKALGQRASDREFDTTTLKLGDVSDLLWAANGVNRPLEGKRTAPSAQNAQDIDVFAFFRSGIYVYDAPAHNLKLIEAGDHRAVLAGRQETVAKAPLIVLLVSDISRFRGGDQALRLEWGAMDAGIVSQNILLFCASEKMACRPRASMDKPKLKELLKLPENQVPMLNIPVAYQQR